MFVEFFKQSNLPILQDEYELNTLETVELADTVCQLKNLAYRMNDIGASFCRVTFDFPDVTETFVLSAPYCTFHKNSGARIIENAKWELRCEENKKSSC